MAQRTVTPHSDERRADAPARPEAQLTGWFMATFLALGLLLAALNPALLKAPAEPVIDGSWAAAYQAAFDEASPLLEPAKTIWGVIEYALFRQGRPGVLVGEDGWLFTTEEFDRPPDEEALANLAANLDFMAQADSLLANRGATLVVALLPAKARIYEEKLGRYRYTPINGRVYGAALEGLRERGMTVIDLTGPLAGARASEEVFLRTDTHWTPFGASVAAETVATQAAELLPDLGGEEFATHVDGATELRGDLTAFLPLGPLYERLGPADDRLQLVSTRSLAGPGSDLFAEVDIPVTLIGTSYSQDERWNFAGALREALGSEVLVAARQGQGPFEPMSDYLASEALASTPPELVVWEVPERYLTTDWRQEETE